MLHKNTVVKNIKVYKDKIAVKNVIPVCFYLLLLGGFFNRLQYVKLRIGAALGLVQTQTDTIL